MTLTTKRFGTLEYREEDIITFPSGLLGFPEHHCFLLRASKKTAPICWLFSLDGSLEFPLARPEQLLPDFPFKLPPRARVLLGKGRVAAYCLLVLPRDLTKATMNLRTPLLINHSARTGVQYTGPELNHQPASRKIYRELFTNMEEK